jgi:hypothetical protein
MVSLLSSADISEVEGRLSQIAGALRQKNVHLLTGGTLERYIPAYTAEPYRLEDEAKRRAVNDEMLHLAKGATEQELGERYGALYDVVCRLPTKAYVDVEPVLRNYLSRYIHDLQSAIVRHPTWDIEQVRSHLTTVQRATTTVFTLQQFTRGETGKFRAIIGIASMLGQGPRRVDVDHQTNAGVGDFRIDPA